MLEQIKQRAEDIFNVVEGLLKQRYSLSQHLSEEDRQFFSELKAKLEERLIAVDDKVTELSNQVDLVNNALEQAESLSTNLDNLISDVDDLLEL